MNQSLKYGLFVIVICLLQSCIQNNSKAPVGVSDKKHDSTSSLKYTPYKLSKTDDTAEEVEVAKYEIDYGHELRRFDQLFYKNKALEHYKYYNEVGAIMIGHLFKSNYRYAVINCQENDSKIKTILMRNMDNNWDTVFIKYSASSFSPYMAPQQTIELKDFDGDSIPDLWVINKFWDIHIGYIGDLWLFKNDTFQYIKNFDQITNPEYDYTTSSIIGYQSEGCADMRMTFERYKIKNTKAVKIEEIYCDCCDFEMTDSCIVYRNNKSKIVHRNKAHFYVPNYYKQPVKNKLAYD